MTTKAKRSVTGVVFDTKKGCVLLIKRCDVPVWTLPGGGIEDGESPQAAVVRELYEETGLNVTVCRHVATYTPINRLANLTYLFECKVDSGSLTLGNETRDIGFFPLEKLPHPFFFVHRDWLGDTQQNQSKVIEKPLNQVTYFALLQYFFRHPLQVMRFALSRIGLPINSH